MRPVVYSKILKYRVPASMGAPDWSTRLGKHHHTWSRNRGALECDVKRHYVYFGCLLYSCSPCTGFVDKEYIGVSSCVCVWGGHLNTFWDPLFGIWIVGSDHYLGFLCTLWCAEGVVFCLLWDEVGWVGDIYSKRQRAATDARRYWSWWLFFWMN